MKLRALKILSLLLTLIMVVNLLPAQIIAAELQELGNASEEDLATPAESIEETSETDQLIMEDAYILAEIVENRTEYSKEYKLSNGLSMAVVYAEAVHYPENGQWKDIDNTLQSIGTATTGMYRTTAGAWHVEFPRQMRENAAVTVRKGEYSVSFAMAGQLTSGEISAGDAVTHGLLDAGGSTQTFTIKQTQNSQGQIHELDYSKQKSQAQHPELIRDKLASKLSYPNVYENTDIVYDLNSYQMKESVVINKYDETLCGYRYILSVDSLQPILNNDGSIDLLSVDDDALIMTMPAPFVVDSSGCVSYDVTVKLEASGDGCELCYYLPQEWLASSERSWPVILDPAVIANTHYSNILDITTTSTGSTTYKDGALMCGYTTYGSCGIMRTFLQYVNLPILSSADVIVNASLSMYACGGASGATIIEAHAVNETWHSETLTWANQPGFNATVEDYCSVDAIETRYYWDITDIVRRWYSDTNTGVLLKVSEDHENAKVGYWKQFYSVDYSKLSTEYPPYLSIVFRNSNGLEDYWDYTSASAGRAGSGYVNNYTGNLTWIRNDLGFGGNRMPVSISHIYNTNDATENNYGLGYGWKTNYHQTIEAVTATDGNVTLQTDAAYVWTDGDGTAHYFVYKNGKYVDEDGMELTLTVSSTNYVIEDKFGNTSTFDSKGRLVSMANNQATKSTIQITYTNTTDKRISQIKDGAGRKYNFTYTGSLLSKISYTSTGNQEITYVSYSYTDSYLSSVTDKDGKSSIYAYGSNNLLNRVTDVDGYNIQYSYSSGTPSRVVGIAEYDGTTAGSSLTIEYAHNQTTFTDHNGNIQITQFNDWGSVICVQDGLGRAYFAQYATNDYEEDGSKGSQLTLSSKMQNSVGNRLNYISFETGSNFTVVSGSGSQTRSTEAAYHGNRSLKITNDLLLQSSVLSLFSGYTDTFSAYVKTSGTTAQLEFFDGTNTYVSEVLPANSDWTLLQVTCSNPGASAVNARVRIRTQGTGTTYVDCVQWEYTAAASRFNLVPNGDFRYSSAAWSTCSGRTTLSQVAGPTLSTQVYKMIGDPTATQRIYQTIAAKGSSGDTFVLSGWAKGDSAPLSGNRQFAIIGTFNYTDGTTSDPFIAQFNPDTDSSVSWQYSAQVMVAKKAYSSIKVEIAYDYNVNTVYFDGIMLFKEPYGNSYTYDTDGNVTSVVDMQKQTTDYEYDTNGNLTKILQDNKAKMTYEYDSYHNVIKATSAEGLVYEFTYDTYGNNTSVSISNGTTKITSTATYSDDGNVLVSTKDALEKETKYGYNTSTNVLEWVQYPEDTEQTRTEYTYDNMYRLTAVAAAVDAGYSLNAGYTYTDDLLTALQTNSSTYTFTYGDFAQIGQIKAGSSTLATYTYTNDQNRYLQQMTYGNGDYVQYDYDDYGRLVKQTYEDGDTVTYVYDNNSVLAKVNDSATGATQKYIYDFTDRLVQYTESGGDYNASLKFIYNDLNYLYKATETIDGRARTYTITYDDDNRVATWRKSYSKKFYTYDAYGRVSNTLTYHTNTSQNITRETFTYTNAGESALSSQVSAYRTKSEGAYDVTYTYAYDDNGNIVSVGDGTYTTTYAYDSANQLIRENNQAGGFTYVWIYDDAGNILQRQEYAYTTGELGTVTDTAAYVYGDSTWGDLLTSYDGQAITYDGIGNPLSDGEWTYTWEHGRELASMSNGDSTWTYTYNADGMRTKRTDGTTTYEYVYLDGQLCKLTVNGLQMFFAYDAGGRPMSIYYNQSIFYYYVTNLQGDVVGIIDKDGTVLVSYTYDAWGNLLSVTGPRASDLGQLNPLRYRSYVYDQETGLYYLQSRYYDPEVGRFLNTDVYTSTGQGLLGNNMFAYCLNNPVTMEDTTGTACRISITAESKIDEEPWRDHSPGGGGYVYHCNNIVTKYDGDKFLTKILFHNIGKFVDKCWNTYVHSNELQVQHLHQQNMANREHWDYVFDSPERTNDFLSIVVTDVAAYSAYVKLATSSTIAFGPTAAVVFGLAGAALTTLSYYGYIDVSGLTWEDLLG